MKSKTKLLKQQELIADIRSETKTFEQIAKEIEGNVTRESKEALAAIREQTASVGVPRLCNALKRDYPNMKPKEIRLRVVSRMCPHVWRENYVRTFWPPWMKDPKYIDQGILGDQSRKPKKSAIFIADSLAEQEEEQTPISSQPIWDYEETHPKTEETPFQAIGEINKSIVRLWTALTGKPNMAHMEDNIKREHIIPTRERFKDIINGSSQVERDFLYNWLTWLNQVVVDRIDLIEKSDKTAYDTRE